MISRRGRQDRGSVLVLTAFLLVLLFTVVAFVIDLGQGRFARRSNQSTVDLAAAAAGYYLAGNGAGDNVNLDAKRACEAAVHSASTNLEVSFTAIGGADCSSFPTGIGTSVCDLTDPDKDDFEARFDGGGAKWILAITYPVLATEIDENRFAGGVGTEDGTDACKRMGVEIARVDSTSFAGVIGVNEIRSSARSVVKGGPALDSEGVAALLILEREGCGAVQTSGQGAVFVQTVVNALGDEQPGVVASDSAGSSTAFGSGLECKTVTNSSGYSIYGTARPQNVGGGPSIIAESTTDSNGDSNHDGIIGSYALEVGGRAACCRPEGLSEEPVGSSITSRSPADKRYNSDALPSISTLHTSGYAATVTNGSTTTGDTDCAPADGKVFDGGGGPIVMNCGAAGGFTVNNGRTVKFENATSVKFVGGVEVRSGGTPGVLQVQDAATVAITRATPSSNARLIVAGTASFDDVSTVYIGGTPNTCTTINNCSAVDVTGTFRVNTGDASTAACAATPGSQTPVGSANNWAKMATFGGEVNIKSGASISWCQTTVYVAKSTDQYVRADYMATSGRINCTEAEPCPLISTANSRNRFLMSGGNAFVRWSAPDQTASPPNAASPFESLALWAEGTGLQEIKGTGDLRTTGVFIMPNATFQFDGQAVAENPFDAQFFARTLNFSGQGVMYLKPDPRNAIPTKIPGEFALIR